jgi:hypothetical protein
MSALFMPMRLTGSASQMKDSSTPTASVMICTTRSAGSFRSSLE